MLLRYVVPETFGTHLAERLAALSLSQNKFGQSVGHSSGFINMVISGERTPPLDKVAMWAEVLKITGKDREEFTRHAYLAHCPDEIRDDYFRLRARVDKLERRVAEFEDKYRDDG